MEKTNREGKKGLYAAELVFLILGIAAVVYYGIIILYAGIGVSFGWFWLLAGAVSLALFLLFRQQRLGRIHVAHSVLAGAVVLLLAGGIAFFLVLGRIVFAAMEVPKAGADMMIVLGAQIRGDQVSKSLKMRLDTAAEYLGENDATQVIVSGGQGQGEDIPESRAMKRYLMEQGISEERIIEEDKSINTNENILFSKEYIKEAKLEKQNMIIVTNGFHIFRGTAIAKKQDIGAVEGLGAPTDRVLLLHYCVREVFAVIKDKLAGNI